MSMQRLPDTTVAKIKSSLVVTCLNQVLIGLVKNSLDARASRINISVDYSRGNCSVEDNGDGIPPFEFWERGGLGKLYCTSKYPPRRDVYGRRGEFLAAIGALSLLFISSRHHLHLSHNSIKIHHSEVLSRHVPTLPDQRLLSFHNGTRVTIRDLFGSMPVRVKQRPSSSSSQREWASLLRSVVAILMVYPSNVTIAILCQSSNNKVCLKSGEPLSVPAAGKMLAFLAKVPRLLWQAGTLASPEKEGWVPLAARAHGISLHGCISLVPSVSKRCQFISLGLEPLSDESGNNLFYDQVNRVFSNSAFGVNNDIEPGQEDNEGTYQRRKGAGAGFQTLKSMRRTERWPMFCLCIDIDSADEMSVDDTLDERRPTLHIMNDLLRETMFEFLRKNGVCTKKDATTKRRQLSDYTLRQRARSPRIPIPSVRNQSPFDVWLVGKPGQSGPRDKSQHRNSMSDSIPQANGLVSGASSQFDDCSSFGSSGSIIRAPSLDTKPQDCVSTDAPPPTFKPHAAKSAETMEVENITTNSVSIIDERTGFMLSSQSGAQNLQHLMPGTKPRGALFALAAGEGSSIAGAPRIVETRLSLSWISNLLTKFETSVFETPFGKHFVSVLENDRLVSGLQTPLMGALESKVSREALRDAQFVGHVDQKYILAKMKPIENSVASSGSLLVILDQHAADERCRVEELMKAYHDADTGHAVALRLDQPIRFDVTRQDANLFELHRTFLGLWGIHYQVLHRSPRQRNEKPLTDGQTQNTIEITDLPSSIYERCRQEPGTLIKILRKQIHSLYDNVPLRSDQGRRLRSDPSWLARFHACPTGILDLINLRACRSSIMFNDPLTARECNDLLMALARCSLPFQCAHGRPSLVPLVHLVDGESRDNEKFSEDDVIFSWDDGANVMSMITGCELVAVDDQ